MSFWRNTWSSPRIEESRDILEIATGGIGTKSKTFGDWLRVSDSHFQFPCSDEGTFRTEQTIRTEHIRWLEHDGDGQCLCAVTAYGTTPLLHVASEEDCWRIVERIEQKFPHLRERWKGQSAFDRHIIRLDLDRKDGL